MSAFSDYSGQIDAKPEEAIKFYFSINDLMLPVSSYASLSKEADNGDNAAQVMEDRVMGLWVKWSTASAFLVPELLELSDERLEAMQNNPQFAFNHCFLKGKALRKRSFFIDAVPCVLCSKNFFTFFKIGLDKRPGLYYCISSLIQ